MKIYFTLIIILVLFLFSCQDLKKDKQLHHLNSLQKTNDSIRNVFYQNKIDTLSKIIGSVRDVELRIKQNYISFQL